MAVFQGSRNYLDFFEFRGSRFSLQVQFLDLLLKIHKYDVRERFCSIKDMFPSVPQECHYLEKKVGVVGFAKARGLVKFQSPRALRALGL